MVCGRLGLGGQFHLVGSSAAMPYLSAAQEVPFVPEWPRLQEKKAACSRWALGRREGELGGEGGVWLQTVNFSIFWVLDTLRNN